ncbi:hypothetical protein LIER_09411 [Lithospermum erythrorhizon]|uniref:BURP domain-containing protein n=1 Tax=Lithospermum erythrorhizon TaxID=34254 RepID=A0AAV3PFM3_LITER
MALSLSFPSFLVLFSLCLVFTFTSSTSTSQSSSTIASKQLNFWSLNVHNEMPQALVSKLSPLTEQDSEALFASFSKQQVSSSSSSKLCSLGNLACAAKLDIITSLVKAYSGYDNNKLNPSAHLAKDDPFSFFRLSILKNGNKINLPDLHDIYPSRSFLPSQIASKITLDLSWLKRVFPQSFVSINTKEAIQMTIFHCNAPNSKGEIKKCPRSLEEMIEFSKNALGGDNLVALTSESTKGSGKELIIGSIKQYVPKQIVSCHEVFLPFSTYYCHVISSTRLYAVELIEPQTNVKVNNVLAICHMDTSTWAKEHVAFKLLKLSPGKGEACHWFSQTDLAWINA